MSERVVFESTPLVLTNGRGAGTRTSYAHPHINRTLVATDGSSNLKRVQSAPVLTVKKLNSIMPMSPFFYNRFYLAKGGTIISSACNLASSIVGAGVLALPYAMFHCGVLTGTLALILICFCTVYSTFVLIKLAEVMQFSTFEDLSGETIGTLGAWLTAFFMVIFCWGVAVVLVVVMGDLISPLLVQLKLDLYIDRQVAMLLFWLFVMFPLSLAKRINTLRYASFIGTASVLLLAGALAVRAIMLPLVEVPRDIPWFFHWDRGTLGALSSFLFSYCCQPVVFQVYSEMNHKSVHNLTLSATASMSVCTVIYILTALLGVLNYGATVKPNILFNLGAQLDVPYVQLAFFGVASSVILSFPICIFPTRDSILLVMGFHADSKPAPAGLSSAVAGLLAFLALLGGLLVPNIRVLFDLLGGICGGSLSFFFPGLIALRSGHWDAKSVGGLHVLGVWVLMFSGIGMCMVGTYNSLIVYFR